MYISMPEELNHVRATHDTPYGTVRSEWQRTEEGIVQSLTAIRQSRSSFRDASGRENK